ncbi:MULTISPECIES: MerR family transcriptional regulator [unclassified Variovorax]|uniref:MerR family transcriptional regulator n=1 Tax=unclassified Variovorax TaxID=663243 RepID=UPI001BD6445E|nr:MULTISPECIES: MerR family transcriptional regulator [unclassified Variovorax]
MPIKEAAPPVTVREAAARLGVTPRTLKYYEERGIVVPMRSEGRYRLYEAADLEKLARALRMKSLGFSLTVITAMLQQPVDEAPEGGSSALSEASLRKLHDTLGEQIAALDARMAQVRRELKEASALHAQLQRDQQYVERRLAGEAPAAALAHLRRGGPAR